MTDIRQGDLGQAGRSYGRYILPDHTQLPDRDDEIVENFQEHPQSILLTDAITPVLRQIHPDGRFTIGQDSGIYWRLPVPPEPLIKGAVAPDWFYVPGTAPMPAGEFRRSYVMWQERFAPLVVLEFISGDGSKERDRTERTGKFWIYEQMVQAHYYGIFDVVPGQFEMWRLESGVYRRMRPNGAGRYPIPEMQAELGVWHGRYLELELDWLRWWDRQGNLLPTGHERAEQERMRADQERGRAAQERECAAQERERAAQERECAAQERECAAQERERAAQEQIRADQEHDRAEQERFRSERLAAQLRALGIKPDA